MSFFLTEELELKNDEIRTIMAKVHTVQCEEQNKATALASTKQQLQHVTEQHAHEVNKITNLEVMLQ